MSKINEIQTVIYDALRISKIVNKHLAETNCQHTIKNILLEALSSDYNNKEMDVHQSCDEELNNHRTQTVEKFSPKNQNVEMKIKSPAQLFGPERQDHRCLA